MIMRWLLKHSVIRHLHISHNTPSLPPKKLCTTFVFLFLPREMKDNAYAKLWGAKKTPLISLGSLPNEGLRGINPFVFS